MSVRALFGMVDSDISEAASTELDSPSDGAKTGTQALRIAAIFIIMSAGLLGGVPPLFISAVRNQESLTTFLIRAFSAGVILALALVHIVPDAIEDLANIGGTTYPIGGTSVLFGIAIMVFIEHGAHLMFGEPHNHSHGNSSSLHDSHAADHEGQRHAVNGHGDGAATGDEIAHHNSDDHHHQQQQQQQQQARKQELAQGAQGCASGQHHHHHHNHHTQQPGSPLAHGELVSFPSSDSPQPSSPITTATTSDAGALREALLGDRDRRMLEDQHDSPTVLGDRQYPSGVPVGVLGDRQQLTHRRCAHAGPVAEATEPAAAAAVAAVAEAEAEGRGHACGHGNGHGYHAVVIADASTSGQGQGQGQGHGAGCRPPAGHACGGGGGSSAALLLACPPDHCHDCVTRSSAPNWASAVEVTTSGGSPLRLRILAYLFELGCIFHSFIIGLSLGVNQTSISQVRALLLALSFHQALEGLSLASVINRGGFPTLKAALMVAMYSVTCPAGVAIGIALASNYDPESLRARASQGILNGVSGGMLLYISLVQLVAEDMGKYVAGAGGAEAQAGQQAEQAHGHGHAHGAGTAGGGGGSACGHGSGGGAGVGARVRVPSFLAFCAGAASMCVLAVWA